MAGNENKGVTKEGWKLLRHTLRAQRKGLLIGVAVGLSWSVGKMAVPQLTRFAIDRGIEKNGSLLFGHHSFLVQPLLLVCSLVGGASSRFVKVV